MFRPLSQPDKQQGLASISVRPFGWLIALGLLLCLRPSFVRRAALLLIPTSLYVMAVFAVGDALPRYLHPIEWVGFVLAILALELLVRLVLRLSNQLRLHLLPRRPPPC
jgi:hypothetical protein